MELPREQKAGVRMNGWNVDVVEGTNACAAAVGFTADEVVSTPFQHPEWLACWLATFPDDGAPRTFLMVVREGATGRVVLRLALGLEIRSGIRVLRGWDRDTCDYGGPILARDFAPSPETFRRVWAQILAKLPRCDVLALDKMPARIGAIDNPLVRLPDVERSFDAAHVLRLGEAPGGVPESFDPSMRRSLARKRRKLQNKGTLVYRVRPAREGLDVLETLLAWRRARFAEENRGHDVAPVEAFWRRLAADADIARVADLSLDGRPIAAGFGTRTGDSFQLLATGFDVAWKNWSPGLLLAEDMIAAAEADGVRLFDFTVGEEAYKLDFAVDTPPLFDLFAPRTLKGWLAMLWRRLQIRRRRLHAERVRAVHLAREAAKLAQAERPA